MIRHMETDREGSEGIADVHFRWAACIEWNEKEELKLYGVGRNAPPPEYSIMCLTRVGSESGPPMPSSPALNLR